MDESLTLYGCSSFISASSSRSLCLPLNTHIIASKTVARNFILLTLYVQYRSERTVCNHAERFLKYLCPFICPSARSNIYKTYRAFLLLIITQTKVHIPFILDRHIFILWAGQLIRYSDWLRAGRSGIESRLGRDFPPVQTGPGAHPASCKMGTGSFQGVKFGRGVLLTTSSAAVMEE